MEQVNSIECLFVNKFIVLFFFVDNIAVIYEQHNSKKVDKFQAKFFKAYDMRYLGKVEWFLGIRITRNRPLRQLRLYQDSYIDKLIAKYKVNITIRAPSTPMSDTKQLTKNTKQATP